MKNSDVTVSPKFNKTDSSISTFLSVDVPIDVIEK